MEIAEVAAMLAERTNNRYLPGFPFPDTIQPTANLAEAVKGIDDVIMAVPSVGFRATLSMLKPLIEPESTGDVCGPKDWMKTRVNSSMKLWKKY